MRHEAIEAVDGRSKTSVAGIPVGAFLFSLMQFALTSRYR